MAMSVAPKMHTYVRTYTCMCVPEMNCTVCMCHVGQKGAKRRGGQKGDTQNGMVGVRGAG